MNRAEACALLDWLEEELEVRPAGADPMGMREIRRLCERLAASPGPAEAIRREIAEVERWAAVLLSAQAHWRLDRPGRPGHVEARRQALDAIRTLRTLIQRGEEDAVTAHAAGDRPGA